ncbi:YegS/Rv2252/BmrU family lipid kinase [Tropicimonas marinistellae]|uniref:YegS/Rv2252/BmrU family lipid kinase n=1 Tax=Tropicimonas marinistellae TaxID=1739787 RepID=UPI0008320950|nr:YegS/Rv2252/BmrU family lipid kinase [Tropicimonas marinistellae]
MTEKSLLILNRKSGARADLRRLVKSFQKEHDLDVRIPWSKKQMRRDIERAVENGCRRIIAGGGDGTVNAVVNALLRLDMGGAVSLGLLPLGTANDFARSCFLPADDLTAAMTYALTAPSQPTDAGRVNEVWFANVASGGFGAMVTATTPTDMKARLGGLAYTLHGLSRLSDFEAQSCRLTMDGGAAREIPLAFMAIGNGRFAGGGFGVTPEAMLDDGALDLAVISHDWQGAPGFLLRELIEPGSAEAEALVYRTFEHGVIETERDFHLNLDGEPMVAQRFDISVLPSALNVVRAVREP